MEQDSSYRVINIQTMCKAKSIRPLKEISKTLKHRRSSLDINSNSTKLVSITQTENNAIGISSVLQENLPHLFSLSIENQKLSSKFLKLISLGIQSNEYLKKISFKSNMISSTEGILALAYAIQSSKSIEELDLSHNRISSDGGKGISELVDSNISLKVLNLSHNCISSAPFAVSLCNNSSLEEFDVSFNPLTFETYTSMLEMLGINKTLKSLSLKGILLEGSAPIKENLNGHLTQSEAVILKLSAALKTARIQSLGIELDTNAEVFLKDLEKTLTKHNNRLVRFDSESIDWKSPELPAPLKSIERALKNNISCEKSTLFAECSHEMYNKKNQNPLFSKDLSQLLISPEVSLTDEIQMPLITPQFSAAKPKENESEISFGKVEHEITGTIMRYIDNSMSKLEKQFMGELEKMHKRIEKIEKSSKHNQQRIEGIEISYRNDKASMEDKLNKVGNNPRPAVVPSFTESAKENVQSMKYSSSFRSITPLRETVTERKEYFPSRELQQCLRSRGLHLYKP